MLRVQLNAIETSCLGIFSSGAVILDNLPDFRSAQGPGPNRGLRTRGGKAGMFGCTAEGPTGSVPS
jgi:hypothetical protein